MTSPAVMERSIAPQGKSMQYLLPARPSILQKLAHQDPFYAKLLAELQNPQCTFFGLDKQARETLRELRRLCPKSLGLDIQ